MPSVTFLRAALRITALAAALVGTSSCAAQRSERCHNICKRESACAEADEVKSQNFDEGECVSACAALERDSEGKPLVERHEQCISKAKSCAEILACE